MTTPTTEVVKTRIPARMDRLPWSRWHWLIVLSLGTVWILDGLEVTVKGAVGASLKESIGFSTVQVAGSASIYIFGAISGALVWGYLTDRFGRKKLFLITLGVYLVGVTGTSLAGLWVPDGTPTFVWFAVSRFITGLGIGGEYSAINSAIDELMPARVRGTVALVVNGSYWLGAGVAAALGYLYLRELPSDIGWRVAFGMGAILAVGILLLRLFVPESPRWLIIHGKKDEAERVVAGIEEKVEKYTGERLEEPEGDPVEIRARRSTGFVEIARTVFKVYPKRAVVGFSLMGSQAFLYNAVFFTYGLMLTTFYGVKAQNVGLFLLPFALGNFLGPVLLGRLFDRVGRRPMIAGTFLLSGLLTVGTGWLFAEGTLNAVWQTVAWVFIFFFASAAASSGYLTVSETFPLEIRAMVIAFFYAIATAIGGIFGPWFFGNLIATESRTNVFYGYLLAGAVMLLAGVVQALFGVRAEQRALEDIAMPLSVEDAKEQRTQEGGGPREEPGKEGTGKDEAGKATAGEERAGGPASPSAPPGHPALYPRSWSTLPPTTSRTVIDDSAVVDREIGVLSRALREDGPARPRELARRVRARYWGPGRYRHAVRTGLARRELHRDADGRLRAAADGESRSRRP
ncbi:MFS transporter [Streptomyces barkulensis]|uniref:MFS transporter n=1 Tax=Streptomyces barkulensis TaxID=1257026 RepID=UPI000C6E5490|nr:MFS transporter [Streptomyces barkulensis]